MFKNSINKIKKLISLIISKNLTLLIGLFIAIFVWLFSYLSANLLYMDKKIVKRGYVVDMTQSLSNKKIIVKDINGIGVGDLPDLTPTKSVDIAAMIAKADISSGARVFKKCAACHTIKKGGANKTGPNLFGIINRKKASISNFSYSDAMKNKGGKWDYQSLNQFLTKPRDYVNGTKMSFAGLKKDKDRANVIAYLESIK